MISSATPICRHPSNITDPMGDRMPPSNAWHPLHPPNMGPSSNAGFHGMGSPLLPRSGDMALPTDAVSINLVHPKSKYPMQNASPISKKKLCF